jgi:3'-phosphoadenosine 5'-phosphosulfate sulfotransferase (PAPS reductase)/FAD synthetase
MTVQLRQDTLKQDRDAIMEQARDKATEGGYSIAAEVVLFSGGQDSTTLAYMFHEQPGIIYAHANTGIGIEATRVFVRETVAGWGRQLIEKHPVEGRTYRDLVLGTATALPRPGSHRYDPKLEVQEEQQIWVGFPGPPGHSIMYRALKENAMMRVRAELLKGKKKSRVIFIAGIRQAESTRRAKRPAVSRDGNTVWASPLLNWKKEDLLTYRRQHPDMPHNEITDLIHMSGECLCGAFAHERELEELEDLGFHPSIQAAVAEIKALEQEAKDKKIVRCKWGFAARAKGEHPALSSSGMMCTTCEDNVDLSQVDTAVDTT